MCAELSRDAISAKLASSAKNADRYRQTVSEHSDLIRGYILSENLLSDIFSRNKKVEINYWIEESDIDMCDYLLELGNPIAFRDAVRKCINKGTLQGKEVHILTQLCQRYDENSTGNNKKFIKCFMDECESHDSELYDELIEYLFTSWQKICYFVKKETR